MKHVKIVVSGTFNAGKSQLIHTISEIPVVSTDRKVTDDTSAIKTRTTTAMDFGRYTFNNVKVGLFGTPGQRRFDFMWDVLSKGMHGFMILVDSSDESSFLEVAYILSVFKNLNPQTAYIIVANKQDLPQAYSVNYIRNALDLPSHVPIVPCNATERSSVEKVLRIALYVFFRSPDRCFYT